MWIALHSLCFLAKSYNSCSRKFLVHNSEHYQNGIRQRLKLLWNLRAMELIRDLLSRFSSSIQCIIRQYAVSVLYVQEDHKSQPIYDGC